MQLAGEHAACKEKNIEDLGGETSMKGTIL
jgi:hypothetical protein